LTSGAATGKGGPSPASDIAPPASPVPTVFTLSGFLAGARMAVPAMPGIMAFAVAFGAGSVQRGLTLSESLAMSLFVSAGASQMLSLELWREAWTLGGLFTIALVTATVNARFMLMGASLQPWMRGAPIPLQAGSLFFLFEASWLVTERHRSEGGRDLGVFLGSGFLSWAVWSISTVPGYLVGALVSDPKPYALDLVMPFFFASLAVPLWRGLARSGLPWAVAAIVALAVQAASPGYLFIIAGSLAGALTGALVHGRD